MPPLLFVYPRHSVYVYVHAYIDPRNHPNVGIYDRHGVSGYTQFAFTCAWKCSDSSFCKRCPKSLHSLPNAFFSGLKNGRPSSSTGWPIDGPCRCPCFKQKRRNLFHPSGTHQISWGLYHRSGGVVLRSWIQLLPVRNKVNPRRAKNQRAGVQVE